MEVRFGNGFNTEGTEKEWEAEVRGWRLEELRGRAARGCRRRGLARMITIVYRKVKICQAINKWFRLNKIEREVGAQKGGTLEG